MNGSNYYATGVTNDGLNNTVAGYQAGAGSSAASSYDSCTLFGYRAGASLTSGDFNTAFGANSLSLCTDGQRNTAFGTYSLSNATGSFNTAVGHEAGVELTGSNNCCVGYRAGMGLSGSSVSSCVFFGSLAGASMTSGTRNLLIGYNCASDLTTGSDIVAVGANTTIANNSSFVISVGNGNVINHSECQVIGHGVTTQAANRLYLGSAAHPLSVAATATAGTGQATPAQVANFLRVYINEVEYRIPYFLP